MIGSCLTVTAAALAPCRAFTSAARRSRVTYIVSGDTRCVSRSEPDLLPIFRSDSQLSLLGQLFLRPDQEQTHH
jgi:hypothetical protein